MWLALWQWHGEDSDNEDDSIDNDLSTMMAYLRWQWWKVKNNDDALGKHKRSWSQITT